VAQVIEADAFERKGLAPDAAGPRVPCDRRDLRQRIADLIALRSILPHRPENPHAPSSPKWWKSRWSGSSVGTADAIRGSP